MTFSNRITLAGAIPLLVMVALAVLVAAIAVVPRESANAAATADSCTKLSSVYWDLLKERYAGLDDFECNTFDPADTGTWSLDTDVSTTTWDFSGKELASFAMSEDDAATLTTLFGAGMVEDTVRYFDLTDNPLTIEDIDFARIPQDVAIILSADSNLAGFQSDATTFAEGSRSYIAMAFPNLFRDTVTSTTVTIDIGGRDSQTPANAGSSESGSNRVALIRFGGDPADEDAERSVVADSEAEDVIFYYPINVDKDNTTEEEWDFTLSVTRDTDGISAAPADFDLDNDEIDVTVTDVDAPSVSVCDRSEDVQENILDVVGATGVLAATYGGHTDCDELTIRDLGNIRALTVDDDDTEEGGALEPLMAGDFSDLSGLTMLHLIGAESLPSGIFAGVGKDAVVDPTADPVVDTTVEITFAANTGEDHDKVGNYTPNTIPSHIWDDQEPGQVIVLTDDTNEDDEGVTSGFDADLYPGTEGGHIFVLTNARTAAWVLGKTVTFGTGADADSPSSPSISNINHDGDDGTTPLVRSGGSGNEGSRVVRFAIAIPDTDDDERTEWLFLFEDADGTLADFSATNASGLKDVATVVITAKE